MPRRSSPHLHWDPSLTREELIAHATSVSESVAGVTVRAGSVPLLRAAGDGLAQAIRLHVASTGPRPAVACSVAAGEHVLDRVEIAPGAAVEVAHLFVPEVDSETPLNLTVTVGEEERTSRIVVTPPRKFSIHLIHHSHFDYGYTDRQAVVMEAQLRYLDAALDLITATDGWPDEAAFRWNVEVTYPLRHWLANRPLAARDELFRRVAEGRIEINALPFSMHSEVYSIDELAWGLRFADRLREEHGVEIVSAIQSDVPGATVGLLNLLTSAGIRNLSVAHNYAGRSVPFRLDGQELTRPFWWQGADGKRLLVWQSDTPHGVAYMDGVLVGLSEDERTARGLLPDYLTALTTRPYPYGRHAFGWHDLPADVPVTKRPYPHDVLCLRVQDTLADNAPPSIALSETVRDWNARWAYPRLRVSTNRDFFAVAERELGDRLDTFSGDWTDWWVDGVGSGALPLGLNRRTQGTIRTARTLHTLAAYLTGETAPAVEAEVDRVYEDMALFDEHTWGAANPWESGLEHMDSGAIEWGKKSSFAYEAFDRGEALLVSGLQHLASAYAASPEALASLVVVNPSSWTRTDLARVFVPAERVASGTSFAVVDRASGRVIPHVVEPQAHPGFRAKGHWVEFAARDVPAVGYATYDVVTSDNATEPVGSKHSGDGLTLESPHYRLEIDRRDGFIMSITDLASGRELVDADAPFGFNEYIYDRYTSGPGVNHLSGRIQDVDLTLFGSRTTGSNASLVSRSTDAVADRATIRLVAEGADWLETTITLPHDVKRVDIDNRLMKIGTVEKESVYFAFPLAVEDADPEYEVTGGVTSQDTPHVPGSARHMFAIRSWLGLRDGQGSAAWATLEAPLVELGQIALPYAPFPPTTPADQCRRSTIYSWALNNIWDTNFPPAQGGEMHFRYALGSDSSLSRRELGIRTGAALSQPLVGVCLRGGAGRGASAESARSPSGSFVSVDSPLVEVVSLAPSRDGGVTAFLHSLADEPIETRIRLPALSPSRARIGNFLERGLTELALNEGQVTVTLAPGAYVALVLSA